MKLVIVNRQGAEESHEVAPGRSLMETLRDAGYDELMALCGGCCSCATCHVHVDAAWMAAVGEPAEFEGDLLDFSDHRQPTSRLSCQIQLHEGLDGLRVAIAPED
jgi:2Fe-2S ferredoxin